MFANGSITTVTDDSGRIYIDLASVIWHIMSSATVLDQSVVEEDGEIDESLPIIIQTLDHMTLAFLELLQHEIEKRNYDNPEELFEMMDRLTQGMPPYGDL